MRLSQSQRDDRTGKLPQTSGLANSWPKYGRWYEPENVKVKYMCFYLYMYLYIYVCIHVYMFRFICVCIYLYSIPGRGKRLFLKVEPHCGLLISRREEEREDGETIRRHRGKERGQKKRTEGGNGPV